MSDYLKAFLVCTAGPFLVLWSFQVGKIVSDMIFHEPPLEMVWWPSHPGWLIASLALGGVVVLGWLLEQGIAGIGRSFRSRMRESGGQKARFQ